MVYHSTPLPPLPSCIGNLIRPNILSLLTLTLFLFYHHISFPPHNPDLSDHSAINFPPLFLQLSSPSPPLHYPLKSPIHTTFPPLFIFSKIPCHLNLSTYSIYPPSFLSHLYPQPTLWGFLIGLLFSLFPLFFYIMCFDFYYWVQRLQKALAITRKNHI